MWYLYILQCNDNSFYTGITKDIPQRLIRHNSGKGARYTNSRRPVKLVYFEQYDNESDARKREWEIKSWKRAKKEKLVLGFSKKRLSHIVMKSKTQPSA